MVSVSIILLCQAETAWPMYHKDAGRTGRTPWVAYSTSVPSVVWKAYVPGSTPPIVGPDSSVYALGTDGVLYRLDALSGAVEWSYSQIPISISPLPVPALNPRGDTIYSATAYDASWYGHIYSIKTSSGSPNWERVLPAYGSWILNPLVVDTEGTLYTADLSNPDGMVHAIYPDNTFKWSVSVPDIGGEEDLNAISLDVVREKVFVGGANSERRILCLSAVDGTYLWSVTTSAASQVSPCVDPASGNIYHPGYDSVLRCINTSGTVVWTRNLPPVGFYSTPALSYDGNVLFFGSGDGNLYALNASDGSDYWSSPVAIPGVPAPAVDANGNIVASSSDGGVYLLDGSTGTIIWNTPVSSQRLSPPACVRWGSSAWIYVSAGDTVYALSAPALNIEESRGSESHPGPGITCSPLPGGALFLASGDMTLKIYGGDGRLVHSGVLKKGRNRISLDRGVYLWRAGKYRGTAVVR